MGVNNIFQLIVDFWHMLLVNDDDVGFIVFFCTTLLCFAFKKIFLIFILFYFFYFCVCLCGCVHD